MNQSTSGTASEILKEHVKDIFLFTHGTLEKREQFEKAVIAAMEAYAYQLSAKGAEGMRWIKASERLQANDHDFVFLKGCRADKGILRKENIEGSEFITLYYNDGLGTQELTRWAIVSEKLDSVFWLDESPLPPIKEQ